MILTLLLKTIPMVLARSKSKVKCLARITPYMNIQKWRTIMKSFVTSQFSYCPSIWMFYSGRLNNKINTWKSSKDHISRYYVNISGTAKSHNRAINITETRKFWQRKCSKLTKVCLQKFQEKHLCPKQVCTIFAETILLKNVECTLHIRVLNRYFF